MKFTFTNQDGKTHSFYPGDTIRFSVTSVAPNSSYLVSARRVASNDVYMSGITGTSSGNGTASGSFQIPIYAKGGIHEFSYSGGGTSGSQTFIVI